MPFLTKPPGHDTTIFPMFDTGVEVVTFYCLDYMVYRTRQKIGFGRIGNHAREKYLNDLLVTQQIHDYRFAAVLYDYLSLACFCEACHGTRMAEMYSDSFTPYKTDRAFRADRAIQFNPRTFLPECERVFMSTWDTHNYGGKSWARIARTAQMKWVLTDHQFIDCVVDMAHNGGPCWGKGFLLKGVDSARFLKFLDVKRTRTIGFWTYGMARDCTGYGKLTRAIVDLIKRGNAIGVQIGMPRIKVADRNHVNLINVDYTPVDWSLAPFGILRTRRYKTELQGSIILDIVDAESFDAAGLQDRACLPTIIPPLSEEYLKEKEEQRCLIKRQQELITQRMAEVKAKRLEEATRQGWMLVDSMMTSSTGLLTLSSLSPTAQPLPTKGLQLGPLGALDWVSPGECISTPSPEEQLYPETRKEKAE